MRCADCHQMNVPEALHCSGCGYALGLEPIYGPGELTCPKCSVDLGCYRAPAGRLFDCGLCGAQFVEHALLKELLERREIAGALFPRKPRQANPLEQPVVYVKCPACGELMNRVNFGGTSGIIVDVCSRHGLWFDPGELPQVLKFVEEGGLALARRLQRERDLPPRPSAPFEIFRGPAVSSAEPESGVWAAIAAVGLGLLELLSSD